MALLIAITRESAFVPIFLHPVPRVTQRQPNMLSINVAGYKAGKLVFRKPFKMDLNDCPLLLKRKTSLSFAL